MGKSLQRFFAVAACGVAVLATSGCSNYGTKTLTTDKNLVGTSQPPFFYYPFKMSGVPGEDEIKPLKADDYENKFPLTKAPPGCPSSVGSFEVLTSGNVKGKLSFNTIERGDNNVSVTAGDFTYPETNMGNQELGPVATGNLFYYYKYEVEGTWVGDTKYALYGQMISNQVPLESKDKVIQFHDYLPSNDKIGQPWNVKGEQKFDEFKKQYPLVEVEAETARFITCHGGPAGSFGVGLENSKFYVIVYAGTCGAITKMKIFRITYEAGKKPAMEEIDPPSQLKEEVKGWTFLPEP